MEICVEFLCRGPLRWSLRHRSRRKLPGLPAPDVRAVPGGGPPDRHPLHRLRHGPRRPPAPLHAPPV